MALNGCQATIVGNTTAPFELRFTPNGTAVGDVTVAVNRRTKVDGEWTDGDPMFVRVTLWEEYAENAAETLDETGVRVTATGELYVRPWETREGDERLSIEMAADTLAPDLRWAQADVTRIKSDGGRGKGRDRDRDDDDREDRGSRGRSSRGRGGRDSRSDRRGSDRGSRRGGRDDRDEREDRGGRSGGRSSGKRSSVWDRDEEGD
jgi:single-strand DNA-binding protein